ncbi:MAG: c-type cytochrome [Polaromonas sp.]
MSRSKPFLSKPFLRTWPLLACLWLLGASTSHAQAVQGHKRAEPSAEKPTVLVGIGRAATPAEIKAWDIDVRPDFKGLPKGQGSVRQGEVLWEAQCASCHGSFAESSEVFTPIAGGITADDIKTGRVDGLMPGANQPNRTTLMKLSTLSTLWDYINRAMPWNAPKTLTTDEVYAATAYILHLGNVLPADFTLSDSNIREVQARLPNRNGMTTAHALWPGKELGGTARPDVQGSGCMRNCKTEVVIKSFLPDYARNAHGNLAEQSRLVGASRGADTSKPTVAASLESNSVVAQSGRAQSAPEKGADAAPQATAQLAKAAPSASAAVMPLLLKNACMACHGMDSKLVGPSFKDIANKYKDRADAVHYLSGKIRAGGQGVWGTIPMPAQSLSPAESAQLAEWLAQGAKK